MSDLLGYGLGVVSRRLAKDPTRYKDYGPYWWALKSAMNEAGYAMGSEFDPVVAAEYTGETAVETLVMADHFRSEFLESYPVGHDSFELAEGVNYVLHDSDMESRV